MFKSSPVVATPGFQRYRVRYHRRSADDAISRQVAAVLAPMMKVNDVEEQRRG